MLDEPPVTPIRKASDGLELPATGFGTYKVNGLAGVDAIKSAIHQGYRLIDSAFNYENEGEVAVARFGGLVKHIGVSNFLPGHIDLLIRDTGVTPAVNQVELHPYFQQREQLSYDNAHGIITEAWSPLGRANQMLRDPDLKRIAAKHGISVVQAILRWHLQYGDVAIPKSLNPERQRQNLDLTAFELDDQDMADIAAMDNPEGHTFGQNPHWHEEA